MECIKCHRHFLVEERIASMSGSIMGDEHTDSYFLCPICGLYTLASWWDNFTGEETLNVSGPLSPQEAKSRIELIQQCPQPWDKKCRCEAHQAYFRGTLD